MPLSIGKAASHGCIRMRNRDVEDLFNRVEVGDAVELVTEVSPDLAEAFGENRDQPSPLATTTAAMVSGGGDAQ